MNPGRTRGILMVSMAPASAAPRSSLSHLIEKIDVAYQISTYTAGCGALQFAKKLLTCSRGRYTLVSAIHKRQAVLCNLRSRQPVSASNLSVVLRQRCPGGFVTPPEMGTGRMDSRAGNRAGRFMDEPVSQRATLHQHFELRAAVMRLREGVSALSEARARTTSVPHRWRQVVPAGQVTQEGDFHHAF